MFSQFGTPVQNAWLTSLLILWAVLLFGGFIFGRPDSLNTRRMPTWTRLGSSLALVIFAWSWFSVTGGTALAGFSLLVAAGMSLGFVGDLFMAAKVTLGGIGAFGLGHVAYILALLQFGNEHGLDAPLARWLAWGAWLLVGLAGWYLAVYRGGKAGFLSWAALPYALLLSSTAGVATGLALQNPSFWPVSVGAALFLFSDLLIAANLFSGLRFRWLDDLIWLTYGPAQALIVLSVATALGIVS